MFRFFMMILIRFINVKDIKKRINLTFSKLTSNNNRLAIYQKITKQNYSHFILIPYIFIEFFANKQNLNPQFLLRNRSPMPINKTQQFLYFQNKAKHYDTIKHIKPAVQDRLQPQFMKTLSHHNSQSPHRQLPIMRRIHIKQQNENLINRLYKMYKSERTQVGAQGNYSRYFKQQRSFREVNPYRQQMNRTIEMGNQQLIQRLMKTKPRIGSSLQWNKHFGKTLSLKKNMSRYLGQSQRSKGSLHISVVDNYVPKYYETFLNTSSVIDLNPQQHKSLPKQIQITHQGLLVLPDIKGKQSYHLSHSIKQTKDNKKLIFDRSKESLHNGEGRKSQSVLDDTKQQDNRGKTKNNAKKQLNNKKNIKNEKRRLLEFKFSEAGSKKSMKEHLVKDKKQNKLTEGQSAAIVNDKKSLFKEQSGVVNKETK